MPTLFWSFTAVWLAWGWGKMLWGDLAGVTLGFPEMQRGRAPVSPLWFGSTTPQLASPPTRPREYRWRYLLLHLFQLHPRWCFSLFCLIFVFQLPITVSMCKNRNLDGGWGISGGIVRCTVGVGLPGQGLSGARASYLLRCCFCWGVAFLKRHTGNLALLLCKSMEMLLLSEITEKKNPPCRVSWELSLMPFTGELQC